MAATEANYEEICAVEKGVLQWTNMHGNEFRIKGRIGFGVSVSNQTFRFTYDGFMVRKEQASGGTQLTGFFPLLLVDGSMQSSKGLSNHVAGRKLTMNFPKGDCWVRSIELTVEIKLDEDANGPQVVDDPGKAMLKAIKTAVKSRWNQPTILPVSTTL